MLTTIQRAQFPDDRRILMISDIHAHAAGLETLLRQAGFGQRDVLVIVGDIIEKGPESLRTLRMVMALCKAYTVYPLMGNVDLWRLVRLLSDDPAMHEQLLRFSLKAQRKWGSCFVGEMCREAGFGLEAGMDTRTVFQQLRERFAKELAFLAGLPAILETQRMIFVHGGIPHEELDSLAGQDRYPLLKRDRFWEEGLAFHKYVVVGHWPTTIYRKDAPCCDPLIDRERHIICLDGGCGLKQEGQLNLLSIPDWRSEDFSLFRWDDLPQIVALDAQERSPTSGYIHWPDHQVTVLARIGDRAQVAYHGRVMTIPAVFLHEQDGLCYCDDMTDLRLAVSPGEKLGLVMKTPDGCYVKKDGVTGWYLGRYALREP